MITCEPIMALEKLLIPTWIVSHQMVQLMSWNITVIAQKIPQGYITATEIMVKG
jgi:hypothetical protein